ncbi:hypothetical protein HBA55_36365 [Pseudomaricurvus alkylphenolicus]|uniref:sodium:solute symporter family transporter n=1 Tax=Pseudomaricurvus alkylphenolicus TaxID=1306991 RepID=UPI00141DDB08|nr:hypothetical protein [Pseudomaricurvus alkylphenolicus]NIB45110.1 hypothetical protein [Pseudomaricurvus alkylphenolicus]
MDAFGSIVGFTLFLVLFLVVGTLVARRSAGSREEYLLGGRSNGKFVVGLSAGAAAASGFIMVGAVGAGYTMGLAAVLFPLSWLLGDLLFWQFFPRRLYNTAKHYNCFTVPALLDAKTADRSVMSVRRIAGLLVVVLIGLYATAQLLAAGKTVSGAFNIDLTWGVVIAAVVILLYCAKGGLKSSIINNFIQAIIILLTTVIMLTVVLVMAGGPVAAFEQVEALDPGLVSFSSLSGVMLAGLVLGWAATALGFDLSSPQFLVRLFSGKSDTDVNASKWVYLSFMQVAWISMSLFGLMLNLFLPGLADPEQGLAEFSATFFSPLLVGIVMGGIFSAIASTLDAQLLVISSALSEDLFPKFFTRLMQRFGTIVQTSIPVLVAGVLIVLATNAGTTVFDLIILSASMLAGAFSPILLVVVFGWKTNALALKAGMMSGFLVCAAWRILGYSDVLLETLPGLVAGLLVHALVVTLCKEAPDANKERVNPNAV